MEFPSRYCILEKNVFKKDEYSIVPIRYEDRFDIMKWRNEQIFHLRQSKSLTKDDQENYFNKVVAKLFEQEKPNQVLFSYLKNNECIGYGGLVHINWIDKNAEISFLMNTELEKKEFHQHWKLFLDLIEKVAFNELNLHKIYTYAFDLRPYLYTIFENNGFYKEAVLKEHCFINNEYKSVVIHAKVNQHIRLRNATKEDVNLFYEWANEKSVRKMSFNSEYISFETHQKWFKNNLNSKNNFLLVLEFDNIPAGLVRFNSEGVIGISLDKKFRGKNLGVVLIKEGINVIKSSTDIKKITAYVKKDNTPSIKIFEKAGFLFEANDVINEKECYRYIYKLNLCDEN